MEFNQVPDQRTQIGRIALRQEGDFWKAYYAKTDTMQDAILIASISLAVIVSYPPKKEAFIELCRGIIADIIEENTGQRPTWPTPPLPAPEHERPGPDMVEPTGAEAGKPPLDRRLMANLLRERLQRTADAFGQDMANAMMDWSKRAPLLDAEAKRTAAVTAAIEADQLEEAATLLGL